MARQSAEARVPRMEDEELPEGSKIEAPGAIKQEVTKIGHEIGSIEHAKAIDGADREEIRFGASESGTQSYEVSARKSADGEVRLHAVSPLEIKAHDDAAKNFEQLYGNFDAMAQAILQTMPGLTEDARAHAMKAIAELNPLDLVGSAVKSQKNPNEALAGLLRANLEAHPEVKTASEKSLLQLESLRRQASEAARIAEKSGDEKAFHDAQADIYASEKQILALQERLNPSASPVEKQKQVDRIEGFVQILPEPVYEQGVEAVQARLKELETLMTKADKSDNQLAWQTARNEYDRHRAIMPTLERVQKLQTIELDAQKAMDEAVAKQLLERSKARARTHEKKNHWNKVANDTTFTLGRVTEALRTLEKSAQGGKNVDVEYAKTDAARKELEAYLEQVKGEIETLKQEDNYLKEAGIDINLGPDIKVVGASTELYTNLAIMNRENPDLVATYIASALKSKNISPATLGILKEFKADLKEGRLNAPEAKPEAADEEELDAGGTEPVESTTPINDYLASLGKEPQAWPSTDESDGNLLDSRFGANDNDEKTKLGKPTLSRSHVESVPDPIHVIGESSIGDQVVADTYKPTPLDKKNPSALTDDERYALFTEYRNSLSPAEFNKLYARGEDGFDEWLKSRQNETEAKGAITPVAKKSYEAPLIQTGELEGTETQHAPERLSTFNRRADVAGVHLETMQRENGSYTLIIDDQSVSLGKDIAIAEKLFNLAMVGVGKAKNKTDFSPLINEIRAARDGQLDARKKNSVPTEDLDDRFWQERSAGKKAAEEAGREWTAEEADKLAREAQARVQESRAAGISKDDHNNAYWQSQRSASARGRYPNGPEKQTTPETKPAGLFAKGPEVLQDDLWDEIEEQPIEKVSKGPDAQKTAATRETFQPLPDAWDKVLKEMEESNPRTETPTVVDRVIVNPDRFPTQQLETIKPDNATETPSDNEWWNKSGVEQLSGAWASLDKSMGDGASEASLITMGVPKSILKKYPTPEALHKFLENPGIWARINGDASETRKALNHFVEAQNNKRIINSPAETLASRSQRDAIDRPRTPKQQLPR